MAFGDRLQALRRSNGLTQEEFAQQLSVSRQAVSKWESSRGYPEMDKIIYICNLYGITLNELFADEVPPVSPSQEATPPAQQPPLKTPPLKKSLDNFFSNLSPHNQQLFGMILALVLVVLLVLLATSMKGETNPVLLKIIWAALLVLFTAGEAITVGLTSIWFAAGSLVALICALLGGPLWLQIGLFIAVSALCLWAIRPLAHKYLNAKVEPTNADRIIGATAPVTENIDNLMGTGAVQIGGMTWSARSESGVPISAGTLVRVLRIEGVKVYVEEAKEEVSCQI